MSRMMSSAAAVAIGVVFVAAQAAAQPGNAPPTHGPQPPPNWVIPSPEPTERGPFLIVAGLVGLGTPVGAAGVEAGVGWHWFHIAAGVGAGFKGPQAMAMVRLVRPAGRIHFGIGAGISRGAALNDLDISLGESSTDEPTDVVNYGPGTVWTNVELLAEQQVWRAVSLRYTLGYGHAVTVDCRARPSSGGPTGPCTTAEQYDHLSPNPYIGVALVWRRGL
jgi:hypothetical protein